MARTSHIVKAFAGEDLTGDLHKLVFFDGADSEKVKVVSSDTHAAQHGILVAESADDAICSVCVEGPAVAIAGGTIEPFDMIMGVATSGKVVVATTAKHAVGRYEPSVKGTASAAPDAADGDLINIVLWDTYKILP